MTILASNLTYFKHQKEIELLKGNTADITFQAMEELQVLIDNAIIQERRNLVLNKIPLVDLYRKKLDLKPFANREIPELLNYFQQAIYLTSSIVYDHDKKTDKKEFDFRILELLSTYCQKWKKYERESNDISTANLSTINQIRVATNKVSQTFRNWTNNTIFKPEVMGIIEKQQKMYRIISQTLFLATHYERYLIKEKALDK